MHWNARDLEQRLANALEVAERAVAFLGDAGWHADEADGVRPEKVLSETALFLLASRDACERTPELSGLHRRIALALLPYARSERIAAMIVLEPVVALDHALIHVCLSRLGFADPRFDRLLAASRSALGAVGRERLPHRAMEQQWLARLAGQPHAETTVCSHGCILDHPLDAIAPTSDDLYAFTHCLMFSTGFGTHSMQFARSNRAITADAEVALARCLDMQDFDVTGELLMTWPFLRQQWSNTATFAFMCLAQVEDEAGFVPAPGMSLQHAASLSGCDRTRHLLAASYHTIYVMGMLCALVLRTGFSPRETVPSSSRYAGAVESLHDAAGGAADGPKLWHRVFERQAVGARAALTPFLLTVLLQRAAARRELATVQRLLRVATRFDLLHLAVACQGIELLQRAALLESMALTGGHVGIQSRPVEGEMSHPVISTAVPDRTRRDRLAGTMSDRNLPGWAQT